MLPQSQHTTVAQPISPFSLRQRGAAIAAKSIQVYMSRYDAMYSLLFLTPLRTAFWQAVILLPDVTHHTACMVCIQLEWPFAIQFEHISYMRLYTHHSTGRPVVPFTSADDPHWIWSFWCGSALLQLWLFYTGLCGYWYYCTRWAASSNSGSRCSRGSTLRELSFVSSRGDSRWHCGRLASFGLITFCWLVSGLGLDLTPDRSDHSTCTLPKVHKTYHCQQVLYQQVQQKAVVCVARFFWALGLCGHEEWCQYQAPLEWHHLHQLSDSVAVQGFNRYHSNSCRCRFYELPVQLYRPYTAPRVLPVQSAWLCRLHVGVRCLWQLMSLSDMPLCICDPSARGYSAPWSLLPIRGWAPQYSLLAARCVQQVRS